MATAASAVGFWNDTTARHEALIATVAKVVLQPFLALFLLFS
jgi:hypothetical protein